MENWFGDYVMKEIGYILSLHHMGTRKEWDLTTR
jgi:hypothetical protein